MGQPGQEEVCGGTEGAVGLPELQTCTLDLSRARWDFMDGAMPTCCCKSYCWGPLYVLRDRSHGFSGLSKASVPSRCI